MFKRILIVVDARPAAGAAIEEGLALARTHGAEVLFFSVLPRYSVPLSDAPPFAAMSPKQFLQEVKAAAEHLHAQATLMAHKAAVTSGSATGSGDDDAACIVQAARTERCDLIVVGSEGRNALLRLLTGSVLPGLVTLSPVPVMVCKVHLRGPGNERPDLQQPRGGDGLRNILVLLEDHRHAQSAVIEGLRLAQVHGAQVLFVHAIPRDVAPMVDMPIMAADSGEVLLRALQEQSRQLLASAQASAREAGVASHSISLPANHAGREIAKLAADKGCDMIVVATDGRNALVRLMSGSVIPGLITAASMPLLICQIPPEPHPDPSSPTATTRATPGPLA